MCNVVPLFSRWIQEKGNEIQFSTHNRFNAVSYVWCTSGSYIMQMTPIPKLMNLENILWIHRMCMLLISSSIWKIVKEYIYIWHSKRVIAYHICSQKKNRYSMHVNNVRVCHCLFSLSLSLVCIDPLVFFAIRYGSFYLCLFIWWLVFFFGCFHHSFWILWTFAVAVEYSVPF